MRSTLGRIPATVSANGVTLFRDASVPSASGVQAAPVNPRPRTEDPRRVRTRAAILSAAATMLSQGDATIAQIARQAGVSIGSIYGHFGSKDVLTLALVDEVLTARADELAATRRHDLPEERISHLGALCLTIALDDPVVFRVLAARSMQPETPPHPLDQIDAGATRALERLDAIVADLSADLEEALGGRPDISVPVAATALLAFWWGLAGMATRQDAPALRSELIDGALVLADRMLWSPAP